MSEIITVGLDLAKSVFQVHGADASGLALLRKKLRRDQVLVFFSQLAPCVVAMEACGGAHFWGREIGKLGHSVRLIPPAYVKPFVKRQSEADEQGVRWTACPPNDAADAEAICEAAQRPSMRFVPVKSEETQGAAMVFRVRELLIRQRTQAINALRGHLAEFGRVVPQGATNAARLIAIVKDPDSGLPADATPTLKSLVAALAHLEGEVGKLDAGIAKRGQGERGRPTADDGSRHQAVDRHGDRGAGPATRDVPPGARLVRRGSCPPDSFLILLTLARPHAAPAFHGRQATARGHDEDGRTIP